MLAELRPLVERAAVGLLADEADPTRVQLLCDPLEALRSAREVRAPQIARPGGRAVGGVRDADAVLQQLELLRGIVEPGREVRRMQQPPKVVARIREMRLGGRRDTAGIDPAEDDVEARRQDIRDVARSRRRYAASGSAATRRSIRSSSRLRMSSPETVVGKRGRRGSRRTIETVGSQAP